MGSDQLHGVSLDPFLDGDKGIHCSFLFGPLSLRIA